jgi:hypothetical protein
LSLAITGFAVPPQGPERRRRYSRFAVWVGKRTPVCYSRATSSAQMQKPPREPADGGRQRGASQRRRQWQPPGLPPSHAATPALHRPCAPRPTAASTSDSWLARAATSRSATTTDRFAAHAPVQHRELVAQHEDLQVPGGGVAGDRASSRMERRRRVGESRQRRWPSSWGQRHGTEPRVDADPQLTATSEFPPPYRFLRGMLPT